MPKPAYPVPGDPISSAWGTQVIDYIGEKWRYVPAPTYNPLNLVNGSTAKVALELTNLPANDPSVVAAEVGIVARDPSGTANMQMFVHDFATEVEAGRSYTTGVAARGGGGGNFRVLVGGTNNRQIKWSSSQGGTAIQVSLFCYGYWVRETILP